MKMTRDNLHGVVSQRYLPPRRCPAVAELAQAIVAPTDYASRGQARAGVNAACGKLDDTATDFYITCLRRPLVVADGVPAGVTQATAAPKCPAPDLAVVKSDTAMLSARRNLAHAGCRPAAKALCLVAALIAGHSCRAVVHDAPRCSPFRGISNYPG